MSSRNNINLPHCGERCCLPLRPTNLRISSPSPYHELNRLAQLEYATGHVRNPPPSHSYEFSRSEKSVEGTIHEGVKAFEKGEAKSCGAGGGAIAGAKMKKGPEMFHQSLGLIPTTSQARADQICPLHVTSRREASEEERRKKDLETFLGRRLAKVKVDHEVNMGLHGNLNGVYAGINSAENRQADGWLGTDETRGVAGIPGANTGIRGQELDMPRVEISDMALPSSSCGTPCNHGKSCNHVWPGCMNSGFFGFRDLAPGSISKDRGGQADMTADEVGSKSRWLKMEVAKKEKKQEEGEEKTNEVGVKEEQNEKMRESQLRVKHEDEWEEEDTKEAGKENKEEGRGDYIHVEAPTECDGIDGQFTLLDHQTPYPRNPKSKWIIVNDFVEDGEEFVFVEKGTWNRLDKGSGGRICCNYFFKKRGRLF